MAQPAYSNSNLHQARYAEFARRGGSLWNVPDAHQRHQQSSVIFSASMLGERPADSAAHRRQDDAFNEIFGKDKKPFQAPKPKRRTDLMPFIDTASPLSLNSQGRVMFERGPMLPTGERWEDGTFASTLRAPEPIDPQGKKHDPEITPFNDGSAMAEARALQRGRFDPLQSILLPGAGCFVEQMPSKVGGNYEPPANTARPRTDINPKQVLPAHPFSDKDAGSGWERNPHSRASTDITAALHGRGEDVAVDRSGHPPHWPKLAQTDVTVSEGTNPIAAPEHFSKKYDRNYVPPPPVNREISAMVNHRPPLKPGELTGSATRYGGHDDRSPWPAHLRHGKRDTDATAHADVRNQERNVARQRRMREAEGLPPPSSHELPEELDRLCDDWENWETKHVSHKHSSDFAAENWQRREEREKRLHFDLYGHKVRYPKPSSDIMGPSSMRRPGLWTRLHGSTSMPELPDDFGRRALAAEGGRASAAEMARTRDELRAKIHEKFATAQRAFRQIDADGSGFLSYDEVVAAVRHFGLPLSDGAVRQLCELADTNGDGRVDYEEFTRAVEQLGSELDGGARSFGLMDLTDRESFDDTHGGMRHNVAQQERGEGYSGIFR